MKEESLQTLSNRVALVTGGSSGIGRAIALALSQAGACLALIGTNQERGERAASDIAAQTGGVVHFYVADVSQKEQVEAAAARVVADLGDVEILINNAGITRDSLLMKLSEEMWDQVIDANLKSLYNTSHIFIRRMLKARWGRIINISSVVGLMGNAGQTNYAASKAGMIGFSKSLAREAASRGVCVNCIAPGFIDTKMTEALSLEQKEALLQRIPLQRFGSPEEVASLCLFLAGPQAAYITGQVIAVDGGMTM